MAGANWQEILLDFFLSDNCARCSRQMFILLPPSEAAHNGGGMQSRQGRETVLFMHTSKELGETT